MISYNSEIIYPKDYNRDVAHLQLLNEPSVFAYLYKGGGEKCREGCSLIEVPVV